MSAGSALAQAIAAKDADTIRGLLAADVDFRALTPGKFWEGTEPEYVVETLFGSWFEPTDEITELIEVEDGPPVEDTEQVRYRVAVRNEDGDHTVEQHLYYRTEGEKIAYVRVLCSGYRPQA